MSYFKKEEIDQFYNIIFNLIDRETFDTMVSVDGSRKIGPYLAKSDVASKMSIEQLQAINDHKWADMFIDGIAHVSWQNGVVHKVFNAFFEAHGWQRQTKVEEYSETWYTNKYYWYYHPDSDIAIKECYRSPNLFSSGCGGYTHSYGFYPISEMPAIPEMIAVSMAQKNGRVWIVDQFSGSKRDCDIWADKQIKDSRNVFVRFVEFDNKRK